MTGVFLGIVIPTAWLITLVVAYWWGRVDSWERRQPKCDVFDLTSLSRGRR